MTKNTTSIIFTGDIGFDRYMAKQGEDEELLSKEVLDYFHSSDHCVANVEGALIAAEDDGSRGVFFHAMDPAATSVLKKIGADPEADRRSQVQVPLVHRGCPRRRGIHQPAQPPGTGT